MGAFKTCSQRWEVRDNAVEALTHVALTKALNLHRACVAKHGNRLELHCFHSSLTDWITRFAHKVVFPSNAQCVSKALGKFHACLRIFDERGVEKKLRVARGFTPPPLPPK